MTLIPTCRFLFLKKASGSVFPIIVKTKLDGKTNVHKSLFWGNRVKMKMWNKQSIMKMCSAVGVL